jgi:hypothetical protein
VFAAAGLTTSMAAVVVFTSSTSPSSTSFVAGFGVDTPIELLWLETKIRIGAIKWHT